MIRHEILKIEDHFPEDLVKVYKIFHPCLLVFSSFSLIFVG